MNKTTISCFVIAALLASLTACASTKGGEPQTASTSLVTDSVIITDNAGNVVAEQPSTAGNVPRPAAEPEKVATATAPAPPPRIARPVIAEPPAPPPSPRPAAVPRRRSVPVAPPQVERTQQRITVERGEEREVRVEIPVPQPASAQRPSGPAMLPLPGAVPGSYAQAPLLQGPVHQVEYEPVVRPRRYGFDYLLTNNQYGGRLLAIEYLSVRFVPCAGYPTLTMTIIDEATRRPVSVISSGAQACFTMADGACARGGSCKVGFRFVRYTAPRSQIETMPLPGGGFAQRTVLYASRLPSFSGDTEWIDYPSPTAGYGKSIGNPL